ncbi:chalcone-flavanone isomerase-domain-containing protein [Cladochytrium replicatum]|nr:chalcone-flavanone isomerase-domain-containing protein [Cladochytrium replicatum]
MTRFECLTRLAPFTKRCVSVPNGRGTISKLSRSIATHREKYDAPRAITIAMPRDASKIGRLVAMGLGAGGVFTAWHLSSTLYADSSPPPGNADEIEPVTKRIIPRTVSVTFPGKASSPTTLSLIGFGIRDVTMVRLAVYTVSLYGDAPLATHLKRSSVWRGFSAASFLSEKATTPQMRVLLDDLLDSKRQHSLALRVEPVRTTNGAHLLGGFVRNLNARLNAQMESMSNKQKIAAVSAIDKFRAGFPAGVIRPGSVFLFTKRGSTLRVEFEGMECVTIENEWIAKEFIEMYLTPEKVISPVARGSMVQGLERWVR